MLLIWGWRALLTVLGTGTFHCPQCGVDTTYRHVRPRKWFTMFFIPVIPLSWLDPYVECTRCKGGFVEAVLSIPTVDQLQHMLGLATRGLFAQLLLAGGAPTPQGISVATRFVQERLGESYTEDQLRADLDHFERTDLQPYLRPLADAISTAGRETLLTNLYACGQLAGVPATETRHFVDAAATALDLTPVHVNGIVEAGQAQALQVATESPWGRDD